jgi:hypothetical protein
MAQQASSRLKTGNNGYGLYPPRSVEVGREHLHLGPVVRELAAAIEADNVSSSYGGRCSSATQLAAHGDGKGASFVPATEDQIEQTHKPPRLKQRSMPTAGTLALLHKREPDFGCLTATSAPEPVALSAPASPVPTASTKQEHKQDDNQNRFETHLEVLRGLTYEVGGSLDGTLHAPPQYAPLLGVAPDLRNPISLKSLTGRG